MGDVIETIIDYGEYATAIARITTLVIRFFQRRYPALARNFKANVALMRECSRYDRGNTANCR